MHDNHVALVHRRGKTHQTISGVVESRPHNKQIAPRDGGVVRKAQHIHICIAHGHGHGICRFAINRAEDDLSAVVHGLDACCCGGIRVSGGVINLQLDGHALQICHGHARRVFKAFRQQRITTL